MAKPQQKLDPTPPEIDKYPQSASHTVLQRYDQQQLTYSLIYHQG